MNLIATQDKLITTILKCYRNSVSKGQRPGYKQPAIRVAENKAQRTIEAMGFTMRQADAGVRDAVEMAILMWECEA